MGFWNTIKKGRFAGLVIFSALFFLLVPTVPYLGVIIAPSYFLLGGGIWTTNILLPAGLIIIYAIVAYFWLVYSGLDDYLLKKKYHR